MDTIKVVCGVIFKQNKILLCKRKSGKSLSGYWEFPGGKIERNETPNAALLRELQEELSIQVEILGHFTTNIHQYEKIIIELIAQKCKFIDGEFILSCHDEIKWVTTNELLNYNLAPADIPIAEMLISETLNQIHP